MLFYKIPYRQNHSSAFRVVHDKNLLGREKLNGNSPTGFSVDLNIASAVQAFRMFRIPLQFSNADISAGGTHLLKQTRRDSL